MPEALKFDHIPAAALTSAADREAILAKGGFGSAFTDHMVTIEWTEGRGWHDAQVRKREPFLIDPASAVLHYAQEIFEGMKAYRAGEEHITLFRPDENAKRFNESAIRMGMPTLPEAAFLQAVNELVKIDKDWIPEGDGSLYLRPFMFANEAFLGVRSSKNYIFCVIASPVGNYFKGGAKPVTVWVSKDYTRAAKGGTGAAKCGGNYAASLVAQNQAYENGCDQVVFLDSAEHKWVEELGGMNVFFVFDDNTIRTTPLTGTILPGITRKSLIALAQAKGYTVEETPYSFAQWQADAASGKLKEVFACGTAAVVAAIGEIRFEEGSFKIAGGETGPVTQALRTELTGIQRGKVADDHGWVHQVL